MYHWGKKQNTVKTKYSFCDVLFMGTVTDTKYDKLLVLKTEAPV